MITNEEDIRRRTGSDNLIGCYTMKENGMTCFTDIHGVEGDLLQDESMSDSDIEIAYHDSNLVIDEF